MNKYLMMIGLAVAILMAPMTSRAQFFVMENPHVGEQVPDFSLKTVDGSSLSLKKFRDGHRSIVFFWATWCPHCREMIKILQANKDQYEKSGIQIALVDVGEGGEVVQKYLTKNKIDMTVFLDEDSVVSEEFALIGVPTFFFIDQNGVVKAVEHTLPDDLDAIF